jgi:signal transduction histidine kinase
MGAWLSSLRVRLLLLVLIAVLPAFGIILWTSLEERSNEQTHAEEVAVQLTQLVATQQHTIIEGARQLFVGLAGAPQILGGDAAACQSYLAGVNAEEKQYIAISLAAPNGDIVCSSVTLNGPVNISDREYVQRMLQTRQFTTGEYVIARGGLNVPTLPFAYPLTNQAGEITGILVSGLDLTWLNQFAAQTELPQGASLTIIDRNGVIFARYPDPDKWVGQTVPDAEASATAASEGQTLETTGVDGVERLYAFSPLGGADGAGAYVRVGFATSSLYASLNERLIRNLSLLGAVAVLALLAAWFGGDGFVLRGMRALVGAARRVKDGDLHARTGLAYDRGEIGQLAGSFDEMAEALQRRIAEQKRAEEQLERTVQDLKRSNEELEQFAYVASHDLQEPLRMVGNYTQLLGRRYKGKLDTDADEFIAYAVDGAKRMQTLINDLLAFSRVGRGGKKLVATDAEAVLERTLRDLGPAAAEAEAKITHDPLPVVVADDVQLGQLLQNLIANAIRFHGDQSPQVHVSARRNGSGYVFSVKDNGIGIAPEYFERIFVIFQRLHGRESYPGTGIGLAVCKKIVERHGGRIWVESAPGQGAAFYFTLHAAHAALAAA